jgi:RES domain-containing protein
MGGPRPEHCRRGGRVNPPGIPMLYLADTVETVIAEVRPFKGAPVSVATFAAARNLRLVDFSPRRVTHREVGEPRLDPLTGDIADVLATIGFEMAEPIDPEASEIAYAPTQYVAEVVRAAGYDGVAYRSALGSGTNIVLFELDDAVLTKRELFRVTDVTYKAMIHDDLVF